MQTYRCKCGEALFHGSGMMPQPCQGCPKCNTTYAQSPDDHKTIEPHDYEIKYDSDGTPYEWCRRCYERGKKLHKPLMLPGMQALHAWITDTCRTNRGDDGAIDEVLRRLIEQLRLTMHGWKIGRGAKIHVGMTVERPEHQPLVEQPIGMTTEDLTGDDSSSGDE